MTFVLKDKSKKASDGIPGNLRPPPSFSGGWWWASRELVTQCESSFLLLFVFFFCVFFLSFTVGFTALVLCISCIYTVRLCISYDEVHLSSMHGAHLSGNRQAVLCSEASWF